MVRAKFYVSDISQVQEDGSGAVTLIPVVAGSPENESFYRFTPGGKIELTILNAPALAFFEKGEEYYGDFTKSRSPAGAMVRVHGLISDAVQTAALAECYDILMRACTTEGGFEDMAQGMALANRIAQILGPDIDIVQKWNDRPISDPTWVPTADQKATAPAELTEPTPSEKARLLAEARRINDLASEIAKARGNPSIPPERK